MTPQDHARIKEIFLAVCAVPSDQQAARLEALCGEDHDLRREVQRLLQHHTLATLAGTAPVAASDAWRNAEPIVVNLTGASPQLGAPPSAELIAHAARRQREFQPGEILAGRYRIVAPLGKGGMGEVYRVDDLTLRQTVALKFLDPEMVATPAWLARFQKEVRIAREVTHPNVCRVFDIGEADGEHYISMEYVDGEDLKSLLKRINRLPSEKACDIARQLCLGLAAAHAKGIVHRDLKPQNVMIDGRGRVRITDFGLAGVVEEIKGAEIRSGTPAYMAPEQTAGKAVTFRSDLYSLGLVLYELFTGTPVFKAGTIQEYARLHSASHPTPPSIVTADIDPAVESLILRCLEKDPLLRPASALEIAAALPGGDLLAAALAANETPSPEMVAAALPRETTRLGPAMLSGIAVTLLAAVAALRSFSPAPQDWPASRSPETLAARIENLLDRLGQGASKVHHAHGFCDLDQATQFVHDLLGPGQDKFQLATHPGEDLVFWYRASLPPLVPGAVPQGINDAMQITPTDPPPVQAGSVTVITSLTGRLLMYLTIPELHAASQATIPEVTWQELLQESQVADQQSVQAASASATLLGIGQRSSWSGHTGERQLPVQIDAASVAGRPMWFAVRPSAPAADPGGPLSKAQRRVVTFGSVRLVMIALTLIALPWAWVNYGSGRGDRIGALRLAFFTFAVRMISSLLASSHVPQVDAEIVILSQAVLGALSNASLVWLFYIALEPHVRRHWPHSLITWNRMLASNWRDPAVGRHILIGLCIGVYWALVIFVDRAIISWFGWPARPMLAQGVEHALGGRYAVASAAAVLLNAVFEGLLFLLLLAVLRWLTRRGWVACILASLIIAVMIMPYGAHHRTAWLTVGLGIVSTGVWAMTRIGLLPLVVAIFAAGLLQRFPITLDLRLWQSDLTLFALALLIALSVWGFQAHATRSTRRRPAPSP